MKKLSFYLSLTFALSLLVACSNDDDNIVINQTRFRITLTNTMNHLLVKNVGSRPLTNTGDTHTVTFQAVNGTRLSFANMFAQSNDWVFGTVDEGIPLWENGSAKTGDISNYIKVYDAGTEEDEDFLNNFPSTRYTAPRQSAPNTGPADNDNTFRDTGRNITNYLTARLAYNASTRTFTLTITKANRTSLHNPGFVTPGILVLHTQPNPLYEVGKPLPANGLESLAEDGSPMSTYNWFNETGSNGAPLRISASHSPFSPGLAYTFSSASDPLFTQGSPATAGSGIEEMAEDGNNAVAVQYLRNNGISAVASAETAPVGPGGTMTFTLNATPGDKLGFATMFVQSNDWFVAFNNNGVELFNADGTPKSGTDYSIQTYLWDAGTEADEPVGFGMNQAPRQSGANTGASDSNTAIRRVGQINDVQFGKGVIASRPGVTALNDARGGYNFITVNIEPLN